jgi:tRNA threonylcarbamoyl adenosine modification protein YeaZ
MILVIDTATSEAVIGLGEEPAGATGGPIATRSWAVRHQHGETLLPALVGFLAEHDATLGDVRAVIVGTGPGAFTGLRVGLATAKGLAHGLGISIVGISTAEALIDAAGDKAAGADAANGAVLLLLPAGPNDRVAVRPGETPELLPGGAEPVLDPDDHVVAVDLAGRAPADAVVRGDAARAGLAAALFRLGVARLAAGAPDDLAGLVPEYVTLPRGVRASNGEVTWSRDHR